MERYDPFAGPDVRFEVKASDIVAELTDPKSGGWLRRRGQDTNAPIFERRGCYITGTLDLRGADLDVLLRFHDCRFENPPDVREARLLGLIFQRCWLPALKARNLRSHNDVRLIDCQVVAADDRAMTAMGQGESMPSRSPQAAAVNLTDAAVDGSVVLTGSSLHNTGNVAMHAARLRVSGALLANRLMSRGEIRMPGVRTGGNIDLSGAQLHSLDRVALDASGASVGGLLICEPHQHDGNGEVATQGGGQHPFLTWGAVFLQHTRVHGDLLLRGARLTIDPAGDPPSRSWNDAVAAGDPDLDPRPAIAADRLRVDGNVECGEGFVSNGTVRMVNAIVGGSFHLARGRIMVRRGKLPPYYDRAVHLDGSTIGGDLQATSLVAAGQLRLGDLEIGGNLLAKGMRLNHPDRDAVAAPRASVKGSVDLSASMIVGTVHMQGIQVGLTVELAGCRLTLPAKRRSRSYSLDMSAASVGRDLLIVRASSNEFSACGGVNLDGASVRRRLSLAGAWLSSLRDGQLSRSDIALDASSVVCEELVLTLDREPTGRVVLRGAHCGMLDDNEFLWHPDGWVELDDFRYDTLRTPVKLRASEKLLTPEKLRTLVNRKNASGQEDETDAAAQQPGVTVTKRIDWLRQGMKRYYRPGPYDQLATVLRASGNEKHAAIVSMRKQQYRYQALAESSWFPGLGMRLWSWMQRVMVGYGHRPIRAVAWLLALLVAGSLWFGLGSDSCVDEPERFQVNGPRCVVNADDTGLEWNPVLHTTDLLVPVVDFGHKGRWHMGGADKWVATGFTASGWILVSTVAAGLTRALRRT
ncbi:oxidoreductase [Haloechinothrix sp. LS1_15]|nr:oxidoreductase [Haloechinothrix sp. LS1_15]